MAGRGRTRWSSGKFASLGQMVVDGAALVPNVLQTDWQVSQLVRQAPVFAAALDEASQRLDVGSQPTEHRQRVGDRHIRGLTAGRGCVHGRAPRCGWLAGARCDGCFLDCTEMRILCYFIMRPLSCRLDWGKGVPDRGGSVEKPRDIHVHGHVRHGHGHMGHMHTWWPGGALRRGLRRGALRRWLRWEAFSEDGEGSM